MEDSPLEYVHRAPGSSSGNAAPAAIVLHGCSADEEDRRRELPDVDARRQPPGARPTPDGILLVRGNHDGASPEPRSRLAVDDAVERFDLDADRIGLLGFSQGAVLSFALLCEHPGRYA